MRYCLLFLLLSGCASVRMPTWYGQRVIILNGPYKDQVGRLIEDCSGFENYRIKLVYKKETPCIRIWNMIGLYYE